MTQRGRGFALIPISLALALLFAPSAVADTYTDQVVARFDAQTHVVADSAGRPPLQNAGQVNQQILTTRWAWSSAPPLWVAAVAPDQTGVTTPDAIHDVILGRNPEFSGVILVIDAKGYHVRAYNVPKPVADNVDPLLSQSARDHRNDPFAATREFVGKLANLNAASGSSVTTSPVSSQKHTSWAWLWTMLIVIGVVLALVGLIVFAVSRNSKRRRDAEAKDQIKQELINAESGVTDINNAVVTGSDVDVSAEATKANSSLYEARNAYQSGDYSAARAHLRVVQATVARAYQKLYPDAKPDVNAVNSVPVADRKQASVQTTDPETGQSVTINNNNYSTSPQPGYQHYYGGGYYNGMFFYPGFYPYAFWGPGWGWGLTDVLLMDALLDDHWGGSYERGFEAGRDSAWTDTGYGGGQNVDYDSQQGNVGFDGSYQGSGDSYSGGDVSFAGGSDSGGYDSGGSFDFGGGFDSGGGGFDSGGGGDSGF
ncbi:hypothetical protein [Mycobacterium sp. Aquia_213]|uniref:hypothetical protein n=1 Tax=Mycobacterium sp. Aquia_213 TaxID=2991728 RepID=UPI00227050F6|nr:hypothetical protein [Mycobacterium sp. Aquia_213]WAC93561.1 hypothetical protein LMQ14_10735 [Mycobacterium sp. Aquia_213]